MSPINIHKTDITAFFKKDIYHIDILGGYGISKNGFHVNLINTKTKEKIESKHSKWPVQGIEFNQRSKRAFEIEIPADGDYLIVFSNAKELKVKRSNLPLFSMLFGEIPNEKLSIYFHRKYT